MRQMKFLFAGVEIGPFSEEQVGRYFREGYLSLSDLALIEGDKEWLPLRKILAKFPLPRVESLPAPPAAPRTVKIETEPLPPVQKHAPFILRVPNPKIISLNSRSSEARVTDKVPGARSQSLHRGLSAR